MILEISPDSSLPIRVAAAAILYLHIAGGTLGIIAGAATLSVTKGGRAHRIVGNVFFVSMLIMTAMAAVTAPLLPKPDWVNFVAALCTFYLVATAWMTVRRREAVRPTATGAFIFAMTIAVVGITVGVLEFKAPHLIGKNPPGGGLVFGSIALLGAVGDLRMILRNGISVRQRIGRHLWRMCLALFIAVVSFFVGQAQVFPESIRGTGFLRLPAFAVLGVMFFWMLRVRFAKQWQLAR